MAAPTNLQPLILAGGKSTRMGFPKHLLLMADGRPLYKHQIELLCETCPEAQTIFVSLAQDSDMDEFLREAWRTSYSTLAGGKRLKVILDTEINEEKHSKGPGSGLLAALDYNPDATWLILACGYPCMTAAGLGQLPPIYRAPVTCFCNNEGVCQPLLGIWSPEAIRQLKENCGKGNYSPSQAFKDLDGLLHLPTGDVEALLYNANTKLEWEGALEKLAEAARQTTSEVA
ncbi:bifunctional molybdenum cofactor biosynthesis [Fusarium longipes]|uniref:Bifunctional molybdenum cofactor biosynthesis n=1 Tax=Fusarium longipes TaxID=694270 RepID=A0A395SKG5_9HYPO|nr:bifunctional molybdenum cofactor biosynthesis [Fusarium longipes]